MSIVEGSVEAYIVRMDESGQVTLPATLREELGVQAGDLFTMVVVSPYILIAPTQLVVTEATEQLTRLMAEKGLTTQDLLDGLEEEGTRLFEERYGQPDSA